MTDVAQLDTVGEVLQATGEAPGAGSRGRAFNAGSGGRRQDATVRRLEGYDIGSDGPDGRAAQGAGYTAG